MADSPTHVRVDVDGAVATITLNRPEARNAYSDEMCVQLCDAIEQCQRDQAVLAVVLTGAGASFHAGGDVKAMKARAGMFAGDPAELRQRYLDGIQAVPRRIATFRKPLICAINGPAVGAGLDLACMCDLRVASRSAKLGSTFVKVGLVPGDGGAFFLARTVGFPRALELMLRGRILSAEEALQIGLVHEVVDDKDLLPRARALADELASLPADALQLTKRAAYESWNSEVHRALELAATYQGVAQNHPDHAARLKS
ncbi:MAG: enoyl-CoA hydratase-related protein [Planctomycetota bacterium]|nr:enoyl-CoA hydratase-related protein [Planctomycetota bacterium]